MGLLAIKGGAPVRTAPFQAWPVAGEEERAALAGVVESGQWWCGERIAAFERAFADFQDARFGVACSSGSMALELGMLACGLQAGDEVIVPPYTFVATASSVVRMNAVPVFADIDPDTANLDLADVARKLTPRTKALLPVHFGGNIVDIDAYRALAEAHGLAIIEDACHSWGGKWKGKGTGALGHCGAFSFQMSKNITAGEGGILLTDDAMIAKLAASYVSYGRWGDEGFYVHFLAGTNGRMTEFQAAVLLAQLSRLEAQTLTRAANAAYLDAQLRDIPGLAVQRTDPRMTRRPVHLYIFCFLPEQWGGVTRAQFLAALQAEGIPVSGGYAMPLYKNPLFSKEWGANPPPHRTHPFYAASVDYSGVVCPNCERMCQEACWIVQSVLLGTEADMRDIADAIHKVWAHRDALRGETSHV